VQLIEEGEVVAITPEGARFFTEDGEVEHKDVEPIDWDDEVAEKGGYETFMLKEIYEQPDAVSETIGDRARRGRLVLEGSGSPSSRSRTCAASCRRVRHGVPRRRRRPLHHRGVGAHPVEPDIASEWRYRNPVLSKDTLVIGITQSGETADTIAAMSSRASRARARSRSRTTRARRSRARSTRCCTRARASRSASRRRRRSPPGRVAFADRAEARLRSAHAARERDRVHPRGALRPAREMEQFLDGNHPIEEIAERHYQKPFFLYLGRHIGLPVALEGALKLKEISYIPTEAYSAGEMKHGPIALLDSETPVVCIATDQKVVYDKVVSNIQEVRARGAQVIAIATDGNEDIQHHADDVIYVPRTPAFLQAVLAVLPLQLLAYRIARLRELNVDQPRNLAKTVTVE
jgi:glucosamine--fructose-6-phosphate aminotransferase (isomerizing)